MPWVKPQSPGIILQLFCMKRYNSDIAIWALRVFMCVCVCLSISFIPAATKDTRGFLGIFTCEFSKPSVLKLWCEQAIMQMS